MERLFYRKILPPISRDKRATKKWPYLKNGPSFQPREKTPFMSAVHNSSTSKHLLDLISRKNPENKEVQTFTNDDIKDVDPVWECRKCHFREVKK